ncbi:outer membrane protein [Sedimentimonas flavescens]|uniref:outer membrane protein n=1 Tax=Sedimentimonas flavescens TaxID=2851012 RepID=UPI0021A4EB3C|nr:outer membrane beta-barrel protein [Sedimentimonas flavescens]MCT2541044.1 outer membrane beta-barrel protein [Sedimentimonas flavescens]
MNKLSCTIAAAALASSAAMAQDAGNWAGSYAGATLDLNNSDVRMTEPFLGRSDTDENFTTLTAFGGHNWQRENFVYGIEARVSSHSDRALITGVPGPGNFESGLGTHGALLFRAGLDQGNYLPFVTVGVAAARLNTYWPDGNTHQNGNIYGPTIGLGADARINKKMLLRGSIDATFYNGTSFNYCGSGCTLTHDVRNINASVGLGYKF